MNEHKTQQQIQQKRKENLKEMDHLLDELQIDDQPEVEELLNNDEIDNEVVKVGELLNDDEIDSKMQHDLDNLDEDEVMEEIRKVYLSK